MREVTDSERIFKRIKDLNDLTKEYDKDIEAIDKQYKDAIDKINKFKIEVCTRIEHLRNHYAEITKPGFKIPKKGFKTNK